MLSHLSDRDGWEGWHAWLWLIHTTRTTQRLFHNSNLKYIIHWQDLYVLRITALSILTDNIRIHSPFETYNTLGFFRSIPKPQRFDTLLDNGPWSLENTGS